MVVMVVMVVMDAGASGRGGATASHSPRASPITSAKKNASGGTARAGRNQLRRVFMSPSNSMRALKHSFSVLSSDALPMEHYYFCEAN